jgi:hypothetical protein
MRPMKVIQFQGSEYVFTGESLSDEGPIATREQYENGLCSYAYLQPDGRILRYNNLIGHRSEITIIGECNLEMKPEALLNLFTDPSWESPCQ